MPIFVRFGGFFLIYNSWVNLGSFKDEHHLAEKIIEEAQKSDGHHKVAIGALREQQRNVVSPKQHVYIVCVAYLVL